VLLSRYAESCLTLSHDHHGRGRYEHDHENRNQSTKSHPLCPAVSRCDFRTLPGDIPRRNCRLRTKAWQLFESPIHQTLSRFADLRHIRKGWGQPSSLSKFLTHTSNDLRVEAI